MLKSKSCRAAERLVCKHWDAIERVAAALIERGELSGDEIDTLLAAAASPEERCCCRPLISRRLCPLRSNCYRIKGLPRIGFLAREIHAREFGDRIELPVPEPHGRVVSHSTVHRFGSESSVGITADAVPEPNRFSPVA